MHYLDKLLAVITLHSWLAYGAIFLISLSESLALVGLIVPGTVIMFGVGAIVATGSLRLTPVLLLAMAGAIAGDSVSYWLGHHYKESLVNIWPFSRYPGILKKGEAFFHRHGGKSILFGRFVGPVRPVIPVVAGMLGMLPMRFGVVNVLSAVGWALIYILPGVFFGASLAVAGTVSTRLAVLMLILAAGTWSFIWLCRKAVSLFERKGPTWLAALKQWATSETSTHGSVRPLKRFFSFLLFLKQGEELLLGLLVLVFFASGWGFLGVLEDVLAKDPLMAADQAVYHFLQSLRTPWADNVFVAVMEIGDSFVNISLTGAVLFVLLVKRCHHAAGFWALTATGGLLAVQLLKWSLHLPRPMPLYHGASAYGFPSGHTTMSVILYGFLAILLAKGVSGKVRWGLFVSVFLLSFFIAFSRLYLGAHWLSDVLGGFFMGASWTALLGIAYLKNPDQGVPRCLLGFVTILVMVVAGGWHVSWHHEKDLAFYSPRYDQQSMPFETWLADGWRDLPGWRIDMAGEREQPLNIQYVGSPEELAQYLLNRGWQRPQSLSLKSFLDMLSPDTPIEKLPVLPRLHDGRIDRLHLVYRAGSQLRVLSMWPTDVKILANEAHLLVGTIKVQNKRPMAGLIFLARDTGEYDSSLAAFEQELNDRFAEKLVDRKNSDFQVSRDQDRVDWLGRVLLVWEMTKL